MTPGRAETPVLPTRRGFLGGTAGQAALCGAAALGLGSCTNSKHRRAAPTPPATPDLAVVSLVTSLENLAVATYQSITDGARRGTYGSLPPALTGFLMAAQRQHLDHAARWNAGLAGVGQRPVNGVDATFRGIELETALNRAKTAIDLANVVLYVENVLAATYLDAIQGRLRSADAIKLAATIQPVEMQHAAVLEFMVGNYPVPDSFAGADAARPVSDQIA